MNYKYLLICCLLLLGISCNQQKESFPYADTTYTSSVFPKPVGFINDFDSIFSEDEETKLRKLVKIHEAATTNQIAVVTINDLKAYDNIEKYSLDLANYWGVGQKDKNNGVLIAIHKPGRKLWIQNGDGLVDKLTDAETSYIIQSKIIPEFKRNDYFKGVYRGIEAIIKEVNKVEND
ncbi:TPM domain protein [Kordia sp. SMS9]|uniref:TPM domain-containing protein n=1 Tax=Kordia sp. SMS9 TaxID=2282170 RepID=UPI000E1036AF|nr:TPM domain-containing protein [Kordia sp. SMS9]AXG69981.1 TPM domain protein [Kordia sp. SMS9]